MAVAKYCGTPCDVILRHLGERINVLHRPPAAGRAQARQQERGRHDLDEIAARHRIGQFAGAGGKFVFHPLAEFRRVRPVRPNCANTSGPAPVRDMVGGIVFIGDKSNNFAAIATFQSWTNFCPFANCCVRGGRLSNPSR